MMTDSEVSALMMTNNPQVRKRKCSGFDRSLITHT